MTHDKLEPVEKEFASRFATPRRHPPPELLRAFAGDALPAEQKSEIDNHLRTCSVCRALVADLETDELSAPTPAETQRIRARVKTETKSGVSSGLWAMFSRPAFAIATLAIVAISGWVLLQKQSPAVVDEPVRQAASSAPRLEMPEVRLRASIVLLMRGDADSQQYLQDLAPALDEYRGGNYATASKEFSSLAPRYPDAIEVFLYGGVSALHEGSSSTAVQMLERANQLGEPEFADDTSWYLALAYQRAGNLEAAQAQLQKLCASEGTFAARACEAAKALPPSKSSR